MKTRSMIPWTSCVVKAITDPDTGEILGYHCRIERFDGSLWYGMPHVHVYNASGNTLQEARQAAYEKWEAVRKNDQWWKDNYPEPPDGIWYA